MKTDINREITCIIPCLKVEHMAKVLDSLAKQSYPIKNVIVIHDGEGSNWSYSGSWLRVVANGESLGKVESLRKALSLVQTELVLCLDSDTVLEETCVEHLSQHVNDEILAVSARIHPLTNSTFIDKIRESMYEVWHEDIGLISGCAFLIRSQTLRDHISMLDTQAEDCELTVILSKPYKRWMCCHEAIAYTQEPRSIRELYRQIRRWYYGEREVEVNESKTRYLTYILLPIFPLLLYVGISLPKEVLEYYSWSIFIFTVVAMFIISKPSNSKIKDFLIYQSIETLASIDSAFRFILRKKSKW